MRKALGIVVWGLLWAIGASASEGEKLSPGTPIEAVVDHYIDAKLASEEILPVPAVDDATLLRRTTLDLLGRIPTAAEARAYVQDRSPQKRRAMVDAHLAAPGFVGHLADELDTLLMEGKGSVRAYLLRALEEDRRWDRMFRDLLIGDQRDPIEKEAAPFLRERVRDPDGLTTDVSILFFGVNISCAKCHDHPLVEDWKQDHFYGMKSFFSRSFENGGFVGERDYGLVDFKTTAGESKTAALMFLSGTVIAEPAIGEPSDKDKKELEKRLKELAKSKEPPPPPRFSRRAQLVEIALRPGPDRFFSRAIVNKTWHRLFGQGLVMPVDQMHSENPPSHPELLDWLADDLTRSGYDLRRLIHGLVLSAAYARGSAWTPAERPSSDRFAVANVRPLTPLQYAAALRLASSDPASFAEGKPEEVVARIESTVASSRGWTDRFAPVHDAFEVGADEALFFSNNERVERELLSGGLVGRLEKAQGPREGIETAFWNVLGRSPRAEEVASMVDYVAKRKDPSAAYRQIVWALLTSSELRFNH